MSSDTKAKFMVNIRQIIKKYIIQKQDATRSHSKRENSENRKELEQNKTEASQGKHYIL